MNRTVVLALVFSAPAILAHADPQQDANDLFAKAQTQYEAGEYRPAIQLFEKAYELVHDPVYLFNIAQSYRKLFDCVPASSYYDRYLAEASDADAAQRNKVQAWQRELAPCVAERKAAAAAARPKVIAPPKPVESHPGRGYRLAGITLAGVGAIGVVVGTVFGKRGSTLEAELAADCSAGCEWTEEQERKDRDGSRANVLAGIGWIAGGAAIAGGVVLYVVGRSKRAEHPIPIVAPAVGGATVSARFSF